MNTYIYRYIYTYIYIHTHIHGHTCIIHKRCSANIHICHMTHTRTHSHVYMIDVHAYTHARGDAGKPHHHPQHSRRVIAGTLGVLQDIPMDAGTPTNHIIIHKRCRAYSCVRARDLT